jgi:hypothetical protein
MIENPQPLWLPLLLLSVPGILLAASALNQLIFPPDYRPLCTIPAIALVLALLPTHVLALAFGSLDIGLAITWSVVGVAGYTWIGRQYRHSHSVVPIGWGIWSDRLPIAVLSTLPIVLPTILLNFFDEGYFNGHHAIIAHLQNGVYPPRYLYDPNLPLRYHYAFDLAGAIVTGLLRVRLDHAVDLLALGLWPCMFLLLWRVGEHFGGKRAGLFVALAVCFAGGWPAVCSPDEYSAGSAGWLLVRLLGKCTVGGDPINPPFIAYFFQHPWSLGVPIFCLVLLQRAALPQLANPLPGLAALICSLALLSLAHAVLFLTTVAALGLTEAWSFMRSRRHTATTVMLALGASLVCAKLIGGFFVSGPFPPAGGLFNTGFFIRQFYGAAAIFSQIQWNVASFGALPVMGAIGLIRAKRDKMFLTTLALVPLIIVNALRYEYTWDIVKFGTVGFIALAIGAGIALSDFATWADTRGRKIICGLAVSVLVGQGVLFPFAMLLLHEPDVRPQLSMQMIRPYFSGAYPLDRDDASAVSFLRTHMRPGEIVYRSEAKSEPYAIWGGLPTQASVYPADHSANDAYGLGEGKFAARINLASISETWLDRLSAERIAWVVTDADDFAINALLEQPEQQGRAILVAQYGDVRIFRIHNVVAALNNLRVDR